LRCPLCFEGLAGLEHEACAACGVATHVACAQEFGGCACQRRRPRPRTPRPAPRPPRPPRRSIRQQRERLRRSAPVSYSGEDYLRFFAILIFVIFKLLTFAF